VDLNGERIELVKEATRKYANVEAIVMDGREYLSRFTGVVDLLYLDFQHLTLKVQFQGLVAQTLILKFIRLPGRNLINIR